MTRGPRLVAALATLLLLAACGDDQQKIEYQTYTARGELVRYSYETAKKLNPDVVFNGLVVEVGTHGLSAVQQMRDLEIVVRENQAHHQGAADGVEPQVADLAGEEEGDDGGLGEQGGHEHGVPLHPAHEEGLHALHREASEQQVEESHGAFRKEGAVR